MTEWRLNAATLDCDNEWGFAIGKYAANGKPLIRQHIHFSKEAPASEVARQLRKLADFVEQHMKD